MGRFALMSGVACIIALTPAVASAETVDEKIKKQLKADLIEIKVQDHTQDACDRSHNITVTSATDKDVVIKPGDIKYFKINKDKGADERSGGWHWKCGPHNEKARIKGATYLKAVRNERGVTDWYWVMIDRHQQGDDIGDILVGAQPGRGEQSFGVVMDQHPSTIVVRVGERAEVGAIRGHDRPRYWIRWV